MEKTKFYTASICLSLLLLINMAVAQTLPNVQAKSQWLPATAKIDGRLSEWGNVLKAFNKAIGVEYTIANDDKNLYLAIRSKDKFTATKIMLGGITFIANPSGENIDRGTSVTFPIAKQAYDIVDGSTRPLYAVSALNMLKDSLAVQKEISNSRDIKVFRLKGVADSVLSVYNPYSIKSKMIYTNGMLIYELSIPLDLISLGTQRSTIFEYNIRLDGVKIPKASHFAPPGPMALPGSEAAKYQLIFDELESPTDLSGKYSLFKK